MNGVANAMFATGTHCAKVFFGDIQLYVKASKANTVYVSMYHGHKKALCCKDKFGKFFISNVCGNDPVSRFTRVDAVIGNLPKFRKLIIEALIIYYSDPYFEIDDARAYIEKKYDGVDPEIESVFSNEKLVERRREGGRKSQNGELFEMTDPILNIDSSCKY